MKKHYYVYKITNRINGKIYIGCHQTDNMDDGYMGSGKYLMNAQKKYGIENFEKEILQTFDTAEEMFLMESKLVNSEFVQRDDTYNIKTGGEGGWNYVNTSKRNLYGKNGENGIKNLVRADELVVILKSKGTYDIWRRRVSDSLISTWKERGHPWLGRSPSNETRRKIGAANSISLRGERNPNYGTRWIHNLELKKSTRIRKFEVLPEGWKEGRKQKF